MLHKYVETKWKLLLCRWDFSDFEKIFLLRMYLRSNQSRLSIYKCNFCISGTDSFLCFVSII